MGFYSGEAIDLQKALNAFENASFHPETLSMEFWYDFGNTALSQAELLVDLKLKLKAVHCFKQGISLCISSTEGWLFLAQALKKVYLDTREEEYIHQINTCFSTASQFTPQDSLLFSQWARFLLEAGRITRDIKWLKESLEKCLLVDGQNLSWYGTRTLQGLQTCLQLLESTDLKLCK